ncbi:MAG: methyltransferase domain-containing protein, partial [Candidatus Bathyarchaeota archaeon]
VLDPFCGSGTTCIAALKTRRHYLGFDINPDYVDLARRRIEDFLAGKQSDA